MTQSSLIYIHPISKIMHARDLGATVDYALEFNLHTNTLVHHVCTNQRSEQIVFCEHTNSVCYSQNPNILIRTFDVDILPILEKVCINILVSAYFVSILIHDHTTRLSVTVACGIGAHLGRNRLWVRFLVVSDTYPMFIEPTIIWVSLRFRVSPGTYDTKIVLKTCAKFGNHIFNLWYLQNVGFLYREW